MKTCIKCDETKPLTEFYKDSNVPDGYRSDCKTCKKAYQSEYYIKNSDEICKRNRGYYAINSEWILQMKQAARDLKKQPNN